MPAYNSASFIAAAVATVAAQTMTDWELLVIDDCSKDDPVQALAAYAADPRIRVIRRDSNGGASSARNMGIDLARGRFIAFLDSDDRWQPEKLERQLEAVLREPDPERVFCVTRTVVLVAGGRQMLRPVRGKRPEEPMDEFIFASGGFCQTSSFFLSRTLARQVQFRQLPIGEDHLFAIDACRLGARYLLIPEPLVEYHDDVRPGRLSGTASLERGRVFMAAVKDVLSPKAMMAYETRYLGVFLFRENPARTLLLIMRALLGGAISLRFATTLLFRIVVPPELYRRVRSALLGKQGTVREA